MPNIDEAIEALLSYQQADMEGVMVLTSRQAIHEVADELKRVRSHAQGEQAPYAVEYRLERDGGLYSYMHAGSAPDGAQDVRLLYLAPTRHSGQTEATKIADESSLVLIRNAVVLAIAFLGRDAGTDRAEHTTPQIISMLSNADTEVRRLLASSRSPGDTAPCPRCHYNAGPEGAERYWEARWRDEKAENDRLASLVEQSRTSTEEMENYRMALAYISRQSTDPESRELAETALGAYPSTESR